MCGESREKRAGRRSARLLVGSVDSRRRFSSRTPRLGTRVFRIKNPGTLYMCVVVKKTIKFKSKFIAQPLLGSEKKNGKQLNRDDARKQQATHQVK